MVIHESERKTRAVYGEGLQNVHKQILIGPRDGFSGYLREFSLEPGGHTPYHRHDWHHAVYVLEGEGSVRYEDVDQPIRRGSVVYTEPDRLHGFSNTGAGPLRFLCLVPEKGDVYSSGD
jgi:quercetin dioxygenase-like cupin family protein